MSYENPWEKGKPIATPRSIVGGKMQHYLTKAKNNLLAHKKAKNDRAQAIVNKNAKAGEQVVSAGFNAIEKDLYKFQDSVPEGSRNVLHGEITNILNGIGEDMTTWMQDNPEATMAQIKMRQAKAMNQMRKVQEGLATVHVAKKEWDKAKKIPPGKEGSIVPNYNTELIEFYEAQENNNPNMHITLDDNDNVRFSILGEDETSEDGVGIESTFDVTEWANNAKEEGRFLRYVSPPDVSNVKTMIDDSIRKKGDDRFGTVNSKGVITYKPNAIQDYLRGQGEYTPVEGQPRTDGTRIVDMMVDDENKYGNWMSMGESIETTADDGTVSSTWSNNVDNFNPDAYRDGMLSEIMTLFPASQSVKTPTKTDTKTDIPEAKTDIPEAKTDVYIVKIGDDPNTRELSAEDLKIIQSGGQEVEIIQKPKGKGSTQPQKSR